MGGGSSSSSSATETTTNTSTATASGVVSGDVLQGQNIQVTNELSDEAVEVFRQLVGFANNAINLAAEAGSLAISTTQESLQQAAQPDVELIQGFQKQVIVAAVVIGVVFTVIFFGKK